MFPKISSPCPMNFRDLPSAERNFCTHCQRSVHNLDLLNASDRKQFLSSCEGKVCVAYTVKAKRPAHWIPAVLIAAVASSSAMAVDKVPCVEEQRDITNSTVVDQSNEVEELVEYIVVGGVSDNPEWVESGDIEPMPVLNHSQAELEFVKPPTDG